MASPNGSDIIIIIIIIYYKSKDYSDTIRRNVAGALYSHRWSVKGQLIIHMVPTMLAWSIFKSWFYCMVCDSKALANDNL